MDQAHGAQGRLMSTAAAGILLEISATRRERLGGEKPAAPTREAFSLPDGAPLQDHGRNAFCAALRELRGNAVIAEVKMGSPKLGSLVGRFEPEELAVTYAKNGAAALSVVVEPDYFFGSYELLARCRDASGLPTIAKDFLVTPQQLEWAREAGADAVLLIASLLGLEELRSYADAAREMGLAPLVETHSREDLAKLADGDWELVGVNNRDLRTFSVDLEHSIGLQPELPVEALKIGESGIRHRADVVQLSDGGFDAFLVGEILVQADDAGAKLRELLGTEP